MMIEVYCDVGDALMNEMVELYMNHDRNPTEELMLAALNDWQARFDKHCDGCFRCRTTTERHDKKTAQSVAG